MDVKSNQSISTINLVEEKPDTFVYYIALKGSLHSSECLIFGLKPEETKALEAKFKKSAHGDNYKTNILEAANALVQLGYRIISSTAFNGDMERVQSLIDKAKNAKDIVTMPDNAGYTALHYAARNGYVDVCKLLLHHGAHIDAQTRSARATPLHKAAASGKIATVNLLIHNGASVDAQDIDGETALHKAIQSKNKELVNIFLQVCPRLQDITDYKGRLPVM